MTINPEPYESAECEITFIQTEHVLCQSDLPGFNVDDPDEYPGEEL